MSSFDRFTKEVAVYAKYVDQANNCCQRQHSWRSLTSSKSLSAFVYKPEHGTAAACGIECSRQSSNARGRQRSLKEDRRATTSSAWWRNDDSSEKEANGNKTTRCELENYLDCRLEEENQVKNCKRKYDFQARIGKRTLIPTSRGMIRDNKAMKRTT